MRGIRVLLSGLVLVALSCTGPSAQAATPKRPQPPAREQGIESSTQTDSTKLDKSNPKVHHAPRGCGKKRHLKK